ncbi:hypothetical protein F66182_5026 [Fusarium sp. NRRL 66182]|nr:hypothetical protein F66182_5026 [Fusarium sp. NRRL 66182]
MYFSLLPVLFLFFVSVPAKPTIPFNKSPYPPSDFITYIDSNGTTRKMENRGYDASLEHGPELEARYKSGGFLDDGCQDVRFYLSKKDFAHKHPERYQADGYEASPWLVANCPDNNGNLRCTWLSLSDCLANIHGVLRRVAHGNFHESCTQCIMRDEGKFFWCRCFVKNKETDYGFRMNYDSKIDLNVLVANRDGYLYCGGGYGVWDYCTKRPSFYAGDGLWECFSGYKNVCG